MTTASPLVSAPAPAIGGPAHAAPGVNTAAAQAPASRGPAIVIDSAPAPRALPPLPPQQQHASGAAASGGPVLRAAQSIASGGARVSFTEPDRESSPSPVAGAPSAGSDSPPPVVVTVAATVGGAATALPQAASTPSPAPSPSGAPAPSWAAAGGSGADGSGAAPAYSAADDVAAGRRPLTLPASGELYPKLERLRALDTASLSRAYRVRTEREELVLEAVTEFYQSFRALYTDRRPLMLAPQNECRTEKFVCATVRPTVPQFEQFYDYRRTVAFVANACEYEPLPEHDTLPAYMCTPATVLRWRVGDCFELSTLLVSLLIGAGYDAYVVVGCAAPELCLNIRTREDPPLDDRGAAPPAAPPAPNKYAAAQRRRPLLESQFERHRQSQAPAPVDMLPGTNIARSSVVSVHFASGLGDARRQASGAAPASDMHLHAWVLIRAGSRDADHNMFVDVASGRIFDDTRHPLFGRIDQAWNNTNVFVNMQDETGETDIVSFNFEDERRWEPILVNENAAVRGGDAGAAAPAGIDDDGDAVTPGLGASLHGSPAARAVTPIHGAHQPQQQQQQQQQLATPTGAAAIFSMKRLTHVLDVVESYVEPIVVSTDSFLGQPPAFNQTIRFRGCLWESYAAPRQRGGCHRCVTLYADDQQTVAKSTSRYYANRCDFLSEYHVDEAARRHDFVYAHGRPDSLKRHTYYEMSGRRELTYFDGSRGDGLVRREDVALADSATIRLFFCHPDKTLLERTIVLGPPRSGARLVAHALFMHHIAQPVIVSVAESHRPRDNGVPVTQQVALYKHKVAAGKIKLVYHAGADRITRSTRIYNTAQMTCSVLEVDPYTNFPLTEETRVQFDQLVAREQTLLDEAQTACTGIQVLLEQLKGEWTAQALELDVYAHAQELVRHPELRAMADSRKEAEAIAEEERMLDPLRSFLPADYDGRRALTRKEAEAAIFACKEAARERAVRRSERLEAQLKQAARELSVAEERFSRQHTALTEDDRQEFTAYSKTMMLRIQVLERRLQEHFEQSKRKWVDLDARLRADPRLAAAFRAAYH